MFAILWSLGKINKMYKSIKCVLRRESLVHSPKNNQTLNLFYRQVRRYYTIRSVGLINPYFVTGFIDGGAATPPAFSIEGGLMSTAEKSSKVNLTLPVKLKFLIRFDDQSLLELIKSYFGCGTVTEYRMNKFIYSVESFSDLEIIISHFDKYSLISEKLVNDFHFFKCVYEMIKSRKDLTERDLNKVLSLKETRVEVFRDIEDPNWLSGFVSRQGNFIIDIRYSTDKILKQIMLKFQVSVNIYDKNLLKSFSSYLGSGSFYSRETRKIGDFRVQKVEDIFNIIIPLFQKYPLLGTNGQKFANFSRVADLIKNKAHLTVAGLEEIVRIKSGMKEKTDLSLTRTTSRVIKKREVVQPQPQADRTTKNIGKVKSSVLRSDGLKGSSSLRSYLAGLIEGDGHIAVHDKNSKSKVFRPKIILVFNIHDKPLADKLSAQLKVGKVISKPKAGHVLLQILAKEEVLNIINLINGYMRTPKIEALHRAINWINERDNSCIPCLGIDLSPLDSNNWLAGFTDADGYFAITLYDRKKNGVFLSTSVKTAFRIEVKQNYSREVTLDQGGASYFNILSEIASFFTVNLYSRTRKTEDKEFYAFVAVAENLRSLEIVRNYFDRFPLYSSKYLSYKDWCLVQDIKKAPLTKENLDKIKIIKNNFNSKRKVFNFSHLDSFAILA
jgi:hypothetical protein